MTREYGAWPRPARARVRALDGVSLDVAPGAALGVVGPNGAGKSTLIRLLLGYIRPTAGRVSVGGLPPRDYAERHGVAYVPELPAVPPRWTVRGALAFYAALGEVPEAEARVDEVLARMELAEAAERRAGTLSKGGLQRLALGQALLGERKVMVLDEPTTGLDPEWVARLRDVVAAWRRADPERVVLMASHDLGEVERVADRVVVLEGGRVRETIDLRAPAAAFPAYRLEVEPAPGAAEAVRAAFPGALLEEGAPLVYRVEAPDLDALNRALAALLAGGVRVRALAPERVTLEERYRRGAKSSRGRKEGGR
ncbi:MAG TPA: ABC transporter ATP-binding protein [Longimicrobium sp.]|nr:ABC transporter ATP-binding protein [Longimicrobium sp.]